MDLLEIADAEHGYIAINGQCVSLDKLISTQSISMTRTGRDGYSYEIECSGNGSRPRPAIGPLPRTPPSTILILHRLLLELHEIE